jgi:hypothetical protein
LLLLIVISLSLLFIYIMGMDLYTWIGRPSFWILLLFEFFRLVLACHHITPLTKFCNFVFLFLIILMFLAFYCLILLQLPLLQYLITLRVWNIFALIWISIRRPLVFIIKYNRGIPNKEYVCQCRYTFNSFSNFFLVVNVGVMHFPALCISKLKVETQSKKVLPANLYIKLSINLLLTDTMDCYGI